MKKYLLLLISFLVFFNTFSSISVHASTTEIILFEDDFESYNLETFPTIGGWKLWYSGLSSQYQIIVDDVSHSGEKALQLHGYGDPIITQSWAAYAAKLVDTESTIIGFNVSVRVESLGDGERDIARVGFASLLPPNRVTNYAPILFKDNGTITVMNGLQIQNFTADKWYDISVVLNRNSWTYSVWVENEMVAENLTVITNRGELVEEETEASWNIEAFVLSQNYHSKKVYFDDVRIFSVYNANRSLKLHPSSGIAATTLVGSGFAPNSRISVFWDDIPIPSVPNNLISDNHGNFSTIITVLNQTTGTYSIRTIDEFNNSAIATFKVTIQYTNQSQSIILETPIEKNLEIEHVPEFPTWLILPIFLIITLCGVLLRRKIRKQYPNP